MSKIPKNPEEIFDEITENYKKIYGEHLISIILYGSAAKGEYVHKKSDINFLIVLSEEGINDLKSSLGVIRKWQKRSVSVPLFLTRSYIASALDSFPMEFLEMRQNHRLVYGEDVLKDLNIDKQYLRLQCERELRGKLLHLRKGYLGTGGNKRALKILIGQSLTAFVSIFTALLYLKDMELPSKKLDVLTQTAEAFELDKNIFLELLQVREGKGKFSKDQLMSLMDKYIAEIRKLTQIVDQL